MTWVFTLPSQALDNLYILTSPIANLLVLDHVSFRKLELSGCGLGDAGLSKLWTGLAGQAQSLETVDTSDNQGIVKSDILRQTLGRLRAIKRLNISGNTRLDSNRPIFEEATVNRWTLSELDLSGIAVSGPNRLY